MFKKFLSIVCVAALSTAFVGCEPTTDLDATPDVVETTDTEVVMPAEDATVPATDAVVEPEVK